MAEPRIYTQNYLDSQSIITTSHGGVTSLLYDRSASSLMTSSGSNTDSLYSVFMNFYENGAPVSRYIDTTFILNHNMAEWWLYRWTGTWTEVASYISVPYTGNPGFRSLYVNHTRFSAETMRIDVDGTSPAHVEKMIGEVIFCDTILGCSDLASYDTKWREKTKEILLGDGAIMALALYRSGQKQEGLAR